MDKIKIKKSDLAVLIQKIMSNYRLNIREQGFSINDDIKVTVKEGNVKECNAEDGSKSAYVVSYLSLIDTDKINCQYEKNIYLEVNQLYAFVLDLFESIGIYSKDLFMNIYSSILEDYLLHELRHLNQFETIDFTLNDIDIITNEKEKTFGVVINEETEHILERDARDFTLKNGRCGITILNDSKLKTHLAIIHYNLCQYPYVSNEEERKILKQDIIYRIEKIKNIYEINKK